MRSIDRTAQVRAGFSSGTFLVTLLVLSIFLPGSAEAACTPASPADGGVLNCTGTVDSSFSVQDLTSLTVNANANFNNNASFNALNIGTLGVVSTGSNFNAVNFTNIGSLTLSISGGNFNGPLTVIGADSAVIVSNTNLQAVTLQNIGVLDLDLVGGNENGALTVSGGILNIYSNVNLPSVAIDVSDTLTFVLAAERNVNNGLTITGAGDTDITNRGNINTQFRITGDGDHVINNLKTVNTPVVLDSNGTSRITNAADAVMNNGIQSIGTSADIVQNSGTIHNGISLGAGDDVLTNLAGTINGDIVAGPGADTLDIVGGTINNRVLGGQGDDVATVSGGIINGGFLGEDGNDDLTWSGGLIRGSGIDMGNGDDIARLVNLPPASLSEINDISGGLGQDALTLENTSATRPDRLRYWEQIDLIMGASLAMGPNLVLGDSGSDTGTLSIDATSTLFAGGGLYSILPFLSGQQVSVSNAGTINLGNGSASDRLTIAGNYVGSGGTLVLDTRFGLTTGEQGSDVIEISGGSASGTTKLRIEPVLPGGAIPTEGNGILVVAATNGGTTDPEAFVLPNGSIGVGPYTYSLYRASIDASGPQNWYLRTGNGLPDPCEPGDNGNGNGGNGNGGNGNGGEDPDPGGLLRPEVPLYASNPALALRYGSTLSDTLHERRGGDPEASDAGGWPQYWGRLVGKHGWQSCRVTPEKVVDYDLFAAQGGIDLYQAEGPDGDSDRAGLYGAFGLGTADSSFLGEQVGVNDLRALTAGGYWTHYGREGWYLDALLHGTWYALDAGSDRPYSLSMNGLGIGGSLEAGYPFSLSDAWTIEPQAQVSYEHIAFGDASDGTALVSFSDVDSLIGRFGVRLAGNWPATEGEAAGQMTGWVRASYAYEFLGHPTTTFSSGDGPVPFAADYSGASVMLDAGFEAAIADDVGFYGSLDYEYQLGGYGESVGAEIGLKARW